MTDSDPFIREHCGQANEHGEHLWAREGGTMRICPGEGRLIGWNIYGARNYYKSNAPSRHEPLGRLQWIKRRRRARAVERVQATIDKGSITPPVVQAWRRMGDPG